MGLSEHEQRVLESIEDSLAGSDPGLASSLATFTRVTADEASPAREKISVGWRRAARRPGRARRYQRRGRTGRAAPRRGERLLAPVLVWLVVSVTMISVALALGHEGKGGSLPCMAWARTCVMQAKQASP